jgi:hypothetical protein
MRHFQVSVGRIVNENKPSKVQHQLAEALDVDISQDTVAVAAARLYDIVGPAIEERYEVRRATQKQIDFGRSVGFDVSGDSMGVAGARIADALLIRNRQLLKELKLQPGDRVRKTSQYGFSRDYTVSSIGNNGRIHFKGGNGAGAWPSEVRKIDALAR